MNDLELDKNRQDQLTPLFKHPGPTRGDRESQRRADFLKLLDSWSQIAASSPFAGYGPDVAAVVADTKAALERGLTPYEALLLHLAPAFLSPDERELEVLEIDEPERG